MTTPSKPTTPVDDYLATVAEPARTTLETLRKVIRAAAPGAEEVLSYRIPTFRLRVGIVAFAAFERHCTFFVMSTAVVGAHANELAGYETGKGSIRFASDEPLPATLVKKLVKARIAEVEEGGLNGKPRRTKAR